jgi:hypothetical protein
MKLLPLLALAALPLHALLAADEAPTQLAERGKLLFSDDLKTLDAKSWHIAKGNWTAADGAVTGKEVPSDNHPGVMRHPIQFKDAVIQYDVRVDGAKMTTFSINDAKEHLARVLINPAGFSAQKDDHDHEGPDKAQLFGRKPLAFKPGEWHTVVIEIVGDTMATTVDKANTITGSNELIGTEKANVGLTVSGESAAYRNLRVWEATAKKTAALK